MTRPASNCPTPAALTDAPRPPNAADEVGQRRGVRVSSGLRVVPATGNTASRTLSSEGANPSRSSSAVLAHAPAVTRKGAPATSHSESQRAAPTVASVTSNDPSSRHPKETSGAGGLGRIGKPSCSSSRRCSLDRMYGVALSRATSGPPARFGGQGSPSPRCVSVGDVRSEALLTARSADPLRALSYTRDRLAKRWALHIPTQRNRDGASRDATFFGGA